MEPRVCSLNLPAPGAQAACALRTPVLLDHRLSMQTPRASQSAEISLRSPREASTQPGLGLLPQSMAQGHACAPEARPGCPVPGADTQVKAAWEGPEEGPRLPQLWSALPRVQAMKPAEALQLHGWQASGSQLPDLHNGSRCASCPGPALTCLCTTKGARIHACKPSGGDGAGEDTGNAASQPWAGVGARASAQAQGISPQGLPEATPL